ncbi:major facilitator superfamily domain-containing protein [Syncephalis pseudoplumigaleata]|uniref:Major facilitator superfamily domain-containing protein n=1 Tax=Syncephalis pseudoplumigaleata TaxID=1712513 RepID=A0A4P9YWJ3_9FUNG|nr:major facilitator superfamily domain-containing protein [Syncephalis pseudoplumigaleata]|eukprot:RKP23671.1 major facilitator superfamily domain-containing protein [Syncephalis pseudoplumigaleata]
MTIALGLLAFKIAGDKAGAVLGTALAIKMTAYVAVAPVVGGFANFLPRRAFLVSMDIARAAVALVLPFVDQVWQVYLLIFILQSASAAFTPTFQATIPDILPDEGQYTRALSLSRLAYDMESLLSPMLAAGLLTVIGFNWLFLGTVVGFFCSAALVLSVTIPQPARAERRGGIYENTTRGIRIYLATPRLRGLLALNLSVAAAGAMVIVNTVVVVRGLLGGTDSDVAIALACFGGGSMTAALMLPRLLDRVADRAVMLPSASILGVTLLGFTAVLFLSRGAVADASLLADCMDPIGRRLLSGDDPIRPLAPSLGAFFGSASGIRCTVCAFTCLLVANLSNGWLAGCGCWGSANVGDTGCSDIRRSGPRNQILARRGSGNTAACASGSI